jgi:hypothetical protein
MGMQFHFGQRTTKSIHFLLVSDTIINRLKLCGEFGVKIIMIALVTQAYHSVVFMRPETGPLAKSASAEILWRKNRIMKIRAVDLDLTSIRIRKQDFYLIPNPSFNETFKDSFYYFLKIKISIQSPDP